MIDSSIALGVKPLEFADPMQQAAHAGALVNQRQQSQLNAERIRQEQLENEQKARREFSFRTFQEAQAAAGGDFDKALQMSRGKIDPETYLHLEKGRNETKEQLGKLDTQSREKLKFSLEQMGTSGQRLLQTPPEAKAPVWAEERAKLLSMGVDPAQVPEQYPGDDAVKSHVMHAVGVEKWLSEARAQGKDQRDIVAATDTHNAAVAALPKTQAEAAAAVLQNDAAALALAAKQGGPEALAAAIAQLPGERRKPFLQVKTNSKPEEILQMGLKPSEQIEAGLSKQRADQAGRPNTAAELALIAADKSKPQADRDAANAALKVLEKHAQASRPIINNTIPGMQVGGGGQNQTTGEEFLKSIPPSIAAQVKAIAEGRSGIPSASSRSQAAVQIRDAVFRYDPTFSEQRAQVRKAFTTGPDGKNVGALNTAIVHLGRLSETAEALQNGSLVPGNELYNWARDKFGSEKVTNFGLLKDAVAGEMAAALKGNATDIEIEKMGKSIRGANSPAQMRGVVSEGMAILNDKATTYNERYHAQMPDDPWSPILPSAKAQLEKHGVGKKPAAGGDTPQINTKAEYDKLPSGAKYVDAQDGKTYTKR